eukprot:TRINITY_DN3527_c0_g3_i1.p1 TRINITY_DN3527_c0_g3~~TRINITY_DN3527_c0_g3_i1.p1  ORF type:complete len:332 (-),score=43.30 TRINITY_DN3527_c0_g3_i1:166-1161(-)
MPRFACPTCNQVFMKWSACQHHLASVHGAAHSQDFQEFCKSRGQALPALRVTVISASGDELELHDVCTVAEVKLSIMKHWHISPDCQTLVTGDSLFRRQCHDGDSLFRYVSGAQDTRLVMNLIASPAAYFQDAGHIPPPPPPMRSQTPAGSQGICSDNIPSAFVAGVLDGHSLHWQPPEIRLTEREECELLGLDVAEFIGRQSDPSSFAAPPPTIHQGDREWHTADDLAMNAPESALLSQRDVEGNKRTQRRPSKKIRIICNKIVEAIMEAYANDPVRLRLAASVFCSQSSYIRGLCCKYRIPISHDPAEEIIDFQLPQHILDLWKRSISP